MPDGMLSPSIPSSFQHDRQHTSVLCVRMCPTAARAERASGGASLWSLARSDEVAHCLALPSCLHRAQALHPCERIPDGLAWREIATELFSAEAFGMLSQECQDVLTNGAARSAAFARGRGLRDETMPWLWLICLC